MNYTVVVNVKDDHDVYIGRAGRGRSGYFGNPVRPYDECPVCESIHVTPGSTIPCYKTYFYRRLDEDPEFKRRVEELQGKRIACFCKPFKKCHGDIIAEYLNERLE